MIRSVLLASSVVLLLPVSSSATEVTSAVTAPQFPAAATAAPSGDALSRRPAGSTSTVTAAAPAPKPAPPADPVPVEPTPDVEIWLGERIGRFGDFEFAVLGGKPAHPTPTGAFRVEWKSRKWWSKQYNAPMPYSVFFHQGCAIHEGSLRSMSHGCVHVSNDAAKHIFGRGKEKVTRVIVYP